MTNARPIIAVWRLVAAAILVISLAACTGTGPAGLPALPAPALPDAVRVRVVNRIVTVPIEEYVLGTALAEVGPTGESPETVARIFEVQAILARTYAASHMGRHRAEGFDMCDTTHCQVYDPARIRTSRFTEAARRAIADTEGQLLAYGTRLTEALFHADCGGHTAAAEVVWGNPVPYLVGTPDEVPRGTHRVWQFTETVERIRTALNGNPTSAVGRHLSSIAIVARDASGRAAQVTLDGETPRQLRGEQVRAVLNQTFGPRAIRSTRFSVRRSGRELVFEGTGYGHGVGLCQVGAAARARRGDAVPDILSTYFPGSRIVRGS